VPDELAFLLTIPYDNRINSRSDSANIDKKGWNVMPQVTIDAAQLQALLDTVNPKMRR
jgi:hypothetical protein